MQTVHFVAPSVNINLFKKKNISVQIFIDKNLLGRSQNVESAKIVTSGLMESGFSYLRKIATCVVSLSI